MDGIQFLIVRDNNGVPPPSSKGERKIKNDVQKPQSDFTIKINLDDECSLKKSPIPHTPGWCASIKIFFFVSLKPPAYPMCLPDECEIYPQTTKPSSFGSMVDVCVEGI